MRISPLTHIILGGRCTWMGASRVMLFGNVVRPRWIHNQTDGMPYPRECLGDGSQLYLHRNGRDYSNVFQTLRKPSSFPMP